MKRQQHLEKYLANNPERTFRAGSILVYQGEAPGSAYILKSGVIKIYTISNQGEERTVDFNVPGNIFPAAWSFRKAAFAFFYHEAMTDVVVYPISRDRLDELMSQNDEVRREITDYFITSYAGSLMRITALEQAKASDKLMHTLYYLLQQYGKVTEKGLYEITLHLTQQMIASLMGLTRETTASELLKLRKKGIVSYKSQTYLINKDSLLQAMGGDNFSGFEF